ncbi:MAG: hypothetical protein NTX86_01035 [Candidatus Dependentiae bacterium]|nr:hypothetical protein [Candidatus Dependentiae bacterium]
MVNDVCFVQLLASDDLCINRIAHRQICSGCFKVYNAVLAPSHDGQTCDACGTELSKRKADTQDIVVKRLEYFHTNIEPFMKKASEFYQTNVIDTECPNL